VGQFHIAKHLFDLPWLVHHIPETVQSQVDQVTGWLAENAANYGARRGSVAQSNAVGEAVSAAACAGNQAPIGEYTVQAVAPGGIAGSELGIRVTYRVPNLMVPLAGLFPGLPRGDFTGDATAIFRQEGW
jgi:hypothetical protein